MEQLRTGKITHRVRGAHTAHTARVAGWEHGRHCMQLTHISRILHETRDFDDCAGKFKLWCTMLFLTTANDHFRKIVRDEICFLSRRLHTFTCDEGIVVWTRRDESINANIIIPREMGMTRLLVERFVLVFSGSFVVNCAPLRTQVADRCVLPLHLVPACVLRRVDQVAALVYSKREMVLRVDGFCLHVEQTVDTVRGAVVLGALPATRAATLSADDSQLFWVRAAVDEIVCFRNRCFSPAPPIDLDDERAAAMPTDPPLSEEADLRLLSDFFSGGIPCYEKAAHMIRRPSSSRLVKQYIFATIVAHHSLSDATLRLATCLPETGLYPMLSTMARFGHRMQQDECSPCDADAFLTHAVLAATKFGDDWLEWAKASDYVNVCLRCASLSCIEKLLMAPTFLICKLNHALALTRPWSYALARKAHILVLKNAATTVVSSRLDEHEAWCTSNLSAMDDDDSARPAAHDSRGVSLADADSDQPISVDRPTPKPKQLKKQKKKKTKATAVRTSVPTAAATSPHETAEHVAAPARFESTHSARCERIQAQIEEACHLIGSGVFFLSDDVDIVVLHRDTTEPLVSFYDRIVDKMGWTMVAPFTDTGVNVIKGSFEGYAVDLQVASASPGGAFGRRAIELTQFIMRNAGAGAAAQVERFHTWASAAAVKGHTLCRLSGIACTVIALMLGDVDLRSALEAFYLLLSQGDAPCVTLGDGHIVGTATWTRLAPNVAPLCVTAMGVNVCHRMTTKTTRFVANMAKHGLDAESRQVMDATYYRAVRRANATRAASMRPINPDSVCRHLEHVARRLDGNAMIEAVYFHAEGDVVHVLVHLDTAAPPERYGWKALVERFTILSVTEGEHVDLVVTSHRTRCLRMYAQPDGDGSISLGALSNSDPISTRLALHTPDELQKITVCNAPYLTYDVERLFCPDAWRLAS